MTWGAFSALKLPPATPRIWPWLAAGESCLLWGGTGTGKSNLAMTLALGIAGGGEVLGWKFPNPCTVLFVDGEQSLRDLQQRFHALALTIKGHDESRARTNLRILARTQGEPGVPFLDLNNPGQVRPFVEMLKAQGVEFVIMDNLSTLSDSLKDENSAAEFKRMQAVCAALKAENIGNILVHHAGKTGKALRGSSNISTTFERVLGLFHNQKEPATVLAVESRIEKYRSKPPPGFSPSLFFRLVTEEDETGRTIKAAWKIDEEQGFLAEAWARFKGGKWGTVAEFVEALNMEFATKHYAKNFRRDFETAWQRDCGISKQEIEKVRGWIGDNRKQNPRRGRL